MDIKAEIRSYIASETVEKVSVDHGIDLEKVKYWAKLPSIEAINWYLEDIHPTLKPPELPPEATPPEPEEGRYLKPHLWPHMQWEGKKLSVLFPTYKDTNPATAWTLVAIALDLGREKVRFDMEFGDAQIDNARNLLAHRFMESGCEWSLWLDDDMLAPIGRAGWYKQVAGLPQTFPDHIAGTHIVDRLMSHKQKFVGGTYFGRNLAGKVMFAEGRTNAIAAKNAREMRQQLIPTQWVAGGCMLIHRDVFVDIQKRFPELAPISPGKIKLPVIHWRDVNGAISNTFSSGATIEKVEEKEVPFSGRKHWDYFRRTEEAGEDIAFCMKARAAGHQIYVDTGCQLQHIGRCAWGAHNTKG